jgi:hypothetical protein
LDLSTLQLPYIHILEPDASVGGYPRPPCIILGQTLIPGPMSLATLTLKGGSPWESLSVLG